MLAVGKRGNHLSAAPISVHAHKAVASSWSVVTLCQRRSSDTVASRWVHRPHGTAQTRHESVASARDTICIRYLCLMSCI